MSGAIGIDIKLHAANIELPEYNPPSEASAMTDTQVTAPIAMVLRSAFT